MKALYKVTFERKWNDGTGWDAADVTTVACSGGAEKAIALARAAILKEPAIPNDEGGRIKVTGFRLVGVEHLRDIDVFA
jgi:hypothetical protein